MDEQKRHVHEAANGRSRYWQNHDPVNHPSHYTQGGVECIDAIQAAVSNLSGPEAWLTGSAIKYLWRWKMKNGLEDLQKAQFYLDRLIKLVDEDETRRKVDAMRMESDMEDFNAALAFGEDKTPNRA